MIADLAWVILALVLTVSVGIMAYATLKWFLDDE